MKWYRQKTTWTGIAGLVSAIGGYLSGTLDAASAIQLGTTALVAIFLRQAVAKTESNPINSINSSNPINPQ